MNTPLRRCAAALAAVAALLAFPAGANTSSLPDYSDLWYTPAESGWGLNVIQNNNIIFMTMYVYGTDNTPRWYVASGMVANQAGNVFTGALYRTNGAYFGAAWDGSLSQTIPVGNATLTFASQNSAVLSYNVDNVTVTKTISRFGFTTDTFTGPYFGGHIALGSGCGNANPDYYIVNRFTATHPTASTVRFQVDINTTSGSATCVYQGSYTKTGRVGQITDGGWACAGAAQNSGTFTMSDIQLSANGFTARFSGRDQFCPAINGTFGGVRDYK